MISETFQHYSHGKLLLSGEYFVLDGARALAVPTQLGQHFSVRPSKRQNALYWRSLNADGQPWFEGLFQLTDLKVSIRECSDNSIAERLRQLLEMCLTFQPELEHHWNVTVTTELEFDRFWGLGSSSALIRSVAAWIDTDPFQLLEKTFGGSGYDVACAGAAGPLIYTNSPAPSSEGIALNWPFKDHLHFIYLGEKMDSRDGITHYKSIEIKNRYPLIRRINALTEQMVACRDLDTFMALMTEHESAIADVLQMQTVKEDRFPDFPGAVKSLGAWGGDFVLVASKMKAGAIAEYFSNRGMQILYSWSNLIHEGK